ncbi:uncharacterized protein B0T15DRAFT_77040 [Chaetomium strumarium]|uniref:Uncharacterized protein n=1 Tax=Chaetomium strumarium TaxID=1170767 RepID=A0AAJ0M733_9PEZI|nr:hypothetical protein B0T15DRAFT_77040 [Chaetomium strumarium]
MRFYVFSHLKAECEACMIPEGLGFRCTGNGAGDVDSVFLFAMDDSSPCCPDPWQNRPILMDLLALDFLHLMAGWLLFTASGSQSAYLLPTTARRRGRTAKVSEHPANLYISTCTPPRITMCYTILSSRASQVTKSELKSTNTKQAGWTWTLESEDQMMESCCPWTVHTTFSSGFWISPGLSTVTGFCLDCDPWTTLTIAPGTDSAPRKWHNLAFRNRTGMGTVSVIPSLKKEWGASSELPSPPLDSFISFAGHTHRGDASNSKD